MTVQIHPFFDPQTYTYSYVVSDKGSGQALIIDSWFDNYVGVISLVRVMDGQISPKQKIKII